MACRPRGVMQSALILLAAALLGVCCLQGYQQAIGRLVSSLYFRRLYCLQEFVVETRPTGREAEHTEDRTSEVNCWHLSSQGL